MMMQLDQTTLAVTGICGVLGLYLLRRHFKGGQFTERVSARGKVAVVTGCNTGIGYETAKELNLRGAKVYMLCRTKDRAEEAKTRLVKEGCDGSRLIYVNLDLGSLESVRKCAAQMAELERNIDILINNAGCTNSKYELTKDSHEKTWQANHLGPLLLTELLLPLIENADAGRIVNVSGDIFRISPAIDLSTVDAQEGFVSMVQSYAKSKLANVMHARELSRRLRTKGNMTVTVNSLHPGVISTELGRQMPILSFIFKIVCWFIMKTRRDGAQTSLYLALSSEVRNVSGCYFIDCKRTLEGPIAINDLACKQLYDYSLKTTGL